MVRQFNYSGSTVRFPTLWYFCHSQMSPKLDSLHFVSTPGLIGGFWREGIEFCDLKETNSGLSKPLWAHLWCGNLDGLPLGAPLFILLKCCSNPSPLSSVGIASKICLPQFLPSPQLQQSGSHSLLSQREEASSLFLKTHLFTSFMLKPPPSLHPPNQPTWHQSSSEMGSSLLYLKRNKINIFFSLCAPLSMGTLSFPSEPSLFKTCTIFPISPCKCYPQPSTICSLLLLHWYRHWHPNCQI